MRYEIKIDMFDNYKHRKAAYELLVPRAKSM